MTQKSRKEIDSCNDPFGNVRFSFLAFVSRKRAAKSFSNSVDAHFVLFAKRFLSLACFEIIALLLQRLPFLEHHAHSLFMNANNNCCRLAKIEYLLHLMVFRCRACIRPCSIELFPFMWPFTSSPM
jgi:hypothetical protein